MNKIAKRIKPAQGFSNILYIALKSVLPILLLFTVRLGFPTLAVAIVLLSKWRMFAVKPRYWLTNIRSNLVDIFIGLSAVAFMSGSDFFVTQVIWAALYTFWLVWLKPRSDSISVMVQALLAQCLALVAFYQAFPEQSLFAGIVAAWLICYASARHFFSAFDEPLTKLIAHIWAWFGASMAWILGHWAIQYLYLPQIALVLTIIGYGLATLYYLSVNEKLKSSTKRQLIGIMSLLLLIVIVFSDWQDKTV